MVYASLWKHLTLDQGRPLMKTQIRLATLTANLLKVLRSQRGLGPAAYPIPLRRLVQLTDPSVDDKTILSLANPQRRALHEHVAIPRRALDVPVALREDLSLLLGSAPLLAFLLAETRSVANHAVTPAALAEKVSTAYRPAFRAALTVQMQADTLPPTVRGLLVNGALRLFLPADVRGGAAGEVLDPTHQAAVSWAAPTEFAGAFDVAFERLDRVGGSHNFVSLVDLRRALPLDRRAFDDELQQLRAARRYSLSAVEGRYELTDEERTAGIWEENALLLHVSRKSA